MKKLVYAMLYTATVISFALTFVAFQSQAGGAGNYADWVDNVNSYNVGYHPDSGAGQHITIPSDGSSGNTSTGANSGTTNPGSGGNTNANNQNYHGSGCDGNGVRTSDDCE